MASIRAAAQWVLEDCREGIGWVAVWKEGRGWQSDRIFGLDFDERTGTAKLEDADELETMMQILARDPQAIIVNGYYYNLGDSDEMTRDSLAAALRWLYENQRALLADFLEGVTVEGEAETLSTYIIDYTRPDGRQDFKTVQACSAAVAVEIFQSRGTDGWTGYDFKDYAITGVVKR